MAVNVKVSKNLNDENEYLKVELKMDSDTIL
jgi:hypothetical protein